MGIEMFLQIVMPLDITEEFWQNMLTSEFAENALSDNPTDTDERRQAVVNQTRIGAKVLDALLDASSAWSQKAIIEEEEEQEENIIESIQEAKIPEKRKKKRTKEK